MRFMNSRSVTVGLLAVLISGLTVAGGVTGTVKYDGAVPKLRTVRMDADLSLPRPSDSRSLPLKGTTGDRPAGQTAARRRRRDRSHGDDVR